MERTLIGETVKKVGEEVTLLGFPFLIRNHGKLIFLDFVDRSGMVQVVGGEKFSGVKPFDMLKIVGKVQKRPASMVNKNIATGEIEISASGISILSKAESLPFDMGQKELNLELPTLLDWRTLTLRHPKVNKIFKVQAMVMEGFREAAKALDCTEIFVPTIAASATEGGAEVFKVDYYEHPAFMVQSPQLYKQMLVPVFERVFTISHAYRAEPSVTTRHLCESIQLDCEMGFVDFNELLYLLEFVGRKTLEYAAENCQDILKEFDIPEMKIKKEIPRLTMREAQKIVLKRTGVDHTKENDLGPEDEKEIGRWAKEERDSDLVTITHYPTKKRAFYTMPDPENPEYSLSYDLIFKGLEILSGSQRINDYQKLVEVIKEKGMDPKNFEMYLQAFKYGMPPEGGFSFGLERLTMQILGLANIREASLFPRDMERVDIRLSKIKK